MTIGEQVPDAEPETFAELIFRVQIELWELFREVESEFQQLMDETKQQIKRIYEEHEP